MANFPTHINIAAAVSGIGAIELYHLELFDANTAFLSFIVGTIGGILPDIDHSIAIPIKIMKYIFSNLLAFITVMRFIDLYPIYFMPLFWGAGFLTAFLLFFIFNKITTHRGMFHSIPAAVVFMFLGVLFFKYYVGFNIVKSYYLGIFIFLGYITHLILDEIFSVDLAGARLKKSFGTALKLWNSDTKSSVAVYVVAFLLFYLLPKKEYMIYIFKRFINV